MEHTGLPFQTIRIFREFSIWMNPKNVFHLHSNRNFPANGKQPQYQRFILDHT